MAYFYEIFNIKIFIFSFSVYGNMYIHISIKFYSLVIIYSQAMVIFGNSGSNLQRKAQLF